jgi:hypothetical protein
VEERNKLGVPVRRITTELFLSLVWRVMRDVEYSAERCLRSRNETNTNYFLSCHICRGTQFAFTLYGVITLVLSFELSPGHAKVVTLYTAVALRLEMIRPEW